MLTKLYATGLKGLDFNEEDLTARTVFTGRVGAGKSARGQAVWLLATGTVPGVKGGKTAGDILDALGDGLTLTVGAEIDGQTFRRVFSRGKGGNATQALYLNEKKVSKGAFDASILHSLQLCDVSAFLAASDAKQVEAVLSLIPGDEAGRVRELNQQEEAIRVHLGNANLKIKGLEASVASMVGSRAELPAVTASLPEVQAEIASLEAELSGIDQQIGEERAQAEAARQAQDSVAKSQEQASMSVMIAAPEQPGSATVGPSGVDLDDIKPGDTFHFEAGPYEAGPRGGVPETPHDVGPGKTYAVSEACETGQAPKSVVHVSHLKRVLETMDRAGCTACAAKMLLKKMIREAS